MSVQGFFHREFLQFSANFGHQKVSCASRIKCELNEGCPFFDTTVFLGILPLHFSGFVSYSPWSSPVLLSKLFQTGKNWGLKDWNQRTCQVWQMFSLYTVKPRIHSYLWNFCSLRNFQLICVYFLHWTNFPHWSFT